MAATPVQSNAAAQNTGLATVAATWTTPATAGNLLLLIVGADDYRTTSGANRPESSGFSLATGCAQETFLGHYLWTKVAAGGETSVNYTIGSASPSCWITAEISGLEASPYDISNGQFAQSSGTTYTTPAITPTAGDRFIIASMGGSLGSAGLTDLTTWLNSFTEVRDVATVLASGTRDIVGIASNSVTANGSTSYSSGATYNATPQARTGIILAFKIAGGATTVNGTASLTGAGTLTAAATVRVSGTTSLTGAGTLTAQATVAVPGAASLAATGTLTTSATVIVPGTASLTGAGTLTASSGTATPGTASLAAAGTLTAAGTVRVPGTASLAGAGSLTAAAQVIQLGTATLTGVGTLSASSGSTVSGTASLVAAGSLTATAVTGSSGTASLAAAGSLSATATVIAAGTASLVGAGSLTAAGGAIISATASLVGTGVLTATVSGRIVYRPNTGTTSRPSTGTITRPNTGIVARP